jgi:hypothetical protein
MTLMVVIETIFISHSNLCCNLFDRGVEREYSICHLKFKKHISSYNASRKRSWPRGNQGMTLSAFDANSQSNCDIVRTNATHEHRLKYCTRQNNAGMRGDEYFTIDDDYGSCQLTAYSI